MKNKFVLDRNGLDVFLDCILGYGITEDEEINQIIEECTYFSSSIQSNNYFFSKNIQRKITKGIYSDQYLNSVYNLQIDKDFFLEEIGSQFIAFLLTHVSNRAIDLDNHLKEIQEDFINNNYGKSIRY